VLQDALLILSALTGVAVAGLSLTSVTRFRRAERKLIRRLRADPEVTRAIREFRTLDQLNVSAAESTALKSAILRHLAELGPGEQRELEQVIRQPSEAGRKNYLAKLLQSVSSEAVAPRAA
jgi:hypothetical protein